MIPKTAIQARSQKLAKRWCSNQDGVQIKSGAVLARIRHSTTILPLVVVGIGSVVVILVVVGSVAIILVVVSSLVVVAGVVIVIVGDIGVEITEIGV